jgi:hypothetical protein
MRVRFLSSRTSAAPKVLPGMNAKTSAPGSGWRSSGEMPAANAASLAARSLKRIT